MSVKSGRPRSFDRQAALERATLTFWRHGYEATSISGLTEAMGIRPPSLYAAFGDKRRLFDEVVARYQDDKRRYLEDAMAEPTAEAAVSRLLHTLAEDYTDPAHPPGCLVISAAVNCTDASADVEEKLRGHRNASRDAIAARIARGVAADELPPDTDPHALATFYAAVVQGMSTQARDGAGTAALHAIGDLAMRAWPRNTATVGVPEEGTPTAVSRF